MASAILSAFPRPPTHIPTTPLPATPGATSTSGSRPPTPSGRRTPGAGAGDKSFGAQQSATLSSSTGNSDAAAHAANAAQARIDRREKRRSRGISVGARSNGHDRSVNANGNGEEPMPRISLESTVVFAENKSRMGDSSPLESTFSHSTHATTTAFGGGDRRSNGGDSRRVSHYENLRRSLYGTDALIGGGGSSSRGSHYSTGTGEGALSTSGSSSLGGLGVHTPGSAFSSRPGSFIGPGTPPLNVPLSASARLAALRAKRAGLGTLTLNGSTSTPSTPTGHPISLGWAGPPPTTPLPPIPTSANPDADKGKRGNNRRSVNLASPTLALYPFPSRERDGQELPTPTTATHASFHRSSPSGATFGHGIGGGHTMSSTRDGDHSRGSSFGSNMDGPNGLASASVFRATAATAAAMRLGMNMGNSSVSTFGGLKNASTSSFGDDGSSGGNGGESVVGGGGSGSGSGGGGGGGRYGHSASYSISTTTSTGTAAAGNGNGGGYRESFGPGLAIIAALSRGEVSGGNGSPISQYSDPNSGSPSGKSAYGGNYGNHTHPPAIHTFSHEDDGAPIDVQKELEALRREKADRRVSTASMLSNFSTRTTNTFRGATSRVMDVNPDEVKDDEAAELAGERLLGSVGDGLEGLAAFGKRKGLGFGSNRLATSSAANSRPGSSKGPSVPPGLGREKGTPSSSGISPEPSLRTEVSRLHSPALLSSGVHSPAATGSSTPSAYSPEEDDADQTITISRGMPTRPQYGRREGDSDTMGKFESGVVGSGSTFNERISAEMDSRFSNGNTVSSQHHLMMKKGSSLRDVPAFKVEEMCERTPVAFIKSPLPDGHTSSRPQYQTLTHGSSHNRNGADDSNLVNIGVWNDAPVTPLSDDFHSSFKPAGNIGGSGDRFASGGRHPASDLRQGSATPSTLDMMGTPRQTRSPSPSNTSISHTTITPFSSRAGAGGSSISSGKPSLDVDRPDSAMSAASASRRRFAPPPALSLSRATPLSSEASLVMPEDEGDDILASPSAGRDRVNHGNSREGPPPAATAATIRKSHRASEDFALKMEKEMAAGGMRGEFALLQEVTIREKRLKLALFGRGVPSALTKPGSRRPQSMVTIEKSLPDSPDRARADGASSPEIGDMIKRSRKSLNAKGMRRRRSTGALAGYAAGDQWRRSEVDLAFGVTPKRGDIDGDGSNRRRAMELDRSGVKVRDSIVLDLPPEDTHPDRELEQDLSADSDSSLDLHTPLPRLMLRAGLLSPHSKILRPPTPEEDSRASWMSSKNGLKVPHDKRNTDKRKRRHRDGKLLREGVGLTTGLGWSDSEDEDAPSPLTRRLSSMTLTSSVSRKASMASSINSFGTSMTSLNLSRSPSMPSIPAGAVSKVSVASKHSSGSGSDTTSRHSGPPSKSMVITGRSPYGRPPESTPRPALKSSATMSIIEHAQMLPTASLFTSKNHPLGSNTRRGTFNFSITNRRSSSPAGNSSQSSNGGVVLPVTPDTDLPPALSNGGGSGMLKDVNTPEDVQGVSGGTSIGLSSTNYSGAGTGLAGMAVGRGRSWTTPPSPTPPGTSILPGSDEPTPAIPRLAEVRYSGGNFSYPTNMRPTGTSNLSSSSTTITPTAPATQATPQLKKPEGLRKPTPRGLQPLTLPTVVHAGGRLSPRAGTFALPSAPSLNQGNPTTPKKTNLPLPGMSISKSSGNIASQATPLPSALARARSGSTGSTGTPSAFAPSKASSRMPQPNRSRTLSGGGTAPAVSPAPPLPQTSAPAATVTFSPLPTPSAGRKAVGALKSFVGARSVSEGASAVPKMLGIARTSSAPGSPPVRVASNHGKTGSGMTYRKSAGSAVEAATTTPPRSRIALPPPTSTSRLVAPSSFTLGRNASTTSLTPSVVGVAL